MRSARRVAFFDLAGADTDTTPDCGKTSASRQTFVSGKAALLAAAGDARGDLASRQCRGRGRAQFNGGAIVISGAGGERRVELARFPSTRAGFVAECARPSIRRPRRSMRTARASPTPCSALAPMLPRSRSTSNLAGSRFCRLICAHDVGRAINPTLVEGQIEGGAAQGLGMALMEEFVPGRSRKSARLSDPDHRRHAAGGEHPHRGAFVRRAVRRQGDRRAGVDPDRAGDLQRHPSRDRRRGFSDAPGDAGSGSRAAILRHVAASNDSHGMKLMTPTIKIRCDACPVMCYIRPGMTGACDRYANDNGGLVRVDPHVLLERTLKRWRRGRAVRRRGARMERRHRSRTGADRHGHRRRYHLSRL